MLDVAVAQRAARFIRTHLWNAADGKLLRRFRSGDAGVEGYAEDYACLIFGLLELFQADGDPAWLEWALALQARLDAMFWDPIGGGWYARLAPMNRCCCASKRNTTEQSRPPVPSRC